MTQLRPKRSGDCPACYANGTLSTLVGRHCLHCGTTLPLSQEEALRTGKLRLHAKPEPESGDALLALIARYGITLPRNAIAWRPVARCPLGTHPLYVGNVRALITDGIVAWFVLGDDKTLFFGHLAAFTPNAVEKPASDKPKRESKAARVKRLLAEI